MADAVPEDGVLFEQVLAMASTNFELLEEFSRLTGIDFIESDKRGDDRVGKLFVAFVYDCIWSRMPAQYRAGEVTPDPEAMRLWEGLTA